MVVNNYGGRERPRMEIYGGFGGRTRYIYRSIAGSSLYINEPKRWQYRASVCYVMYVHVYGGI